MDIVEGSRDKRHATGMGVAVAVAALVVTGVTGAPARAAQTLVVDDDGLQCGTGSYTSISAALDAAEGGDTITVCPGTYAERFDVTKSVRIIGAVDAVAGLDCFATAPMAPGDLDRSLFAVLEPPAPPTTEATEPLMTIAADDVELAGLVIQGVIDDTPVRDPSNTWDIFQPALATGDAYSGYRIHHNLFRFNTLGVEFGSSGATPSHFDHNCVRENRWGLATQRLSLENALIGSNDWFRTEVITVELGLGQGSTDFVVVRENTLHEAGYGLAVEKSTNATVSDNHVTAATNRGIWVSAGNVGVLVSDNRIEGGDSHTQAAAGIFTTGFNSPLPRSTGVVIRDNTVTGIRTSDSPGASGGYGIAIGNRSLNGGEVRDNRVSGNGLAGIALFSNNQDVLLRDNVANDNLQWGIRAQGTGLSGNVFRDNRMTGNAQFDASDATDTNLNDGVQLLNAWISNKCVTDQPAGAICGRK